MKTLTLLVTILVLCQALSRKLRHTSLRENAARKLKTKLRGTRLKKKKDKTDAEVLAEVAKLVSEQAESSAKEIVLMGGFKKEGDGRKEVDSIVKNGIGFFKKGQQVFKGRDRQSESQSQFVVKKVVEVVALVDAGIQLVLQNKGFIENLAQNTKLLSDSGLLTALGPIGMAVGLGLNILTMGLRLYKGEGIFPPSPADLQMAATKEVGSKVDELSDKMEYLFGKMEKTQKHQQAMQQYFECEEKMMYARDQYTVLKRVCFQRGQEGLVQDDDDLKAFYTDKDLKVNEGYLNECDVEISKFLARMQDVEFEYNFLLFMKMFSGRTGLMGENFWKALLKDNSNNFKEFGDAWNLINELAIESILVFQTFNVVFHKKAMADTLKIKIDQQQMQGKQRSEDDITADTFTLLNGASSCRNCGELDESILGMHQQAVDNYNIAMGSDQSYLKKITSENEAVLLKYTTSKTDLQPALYAAIQNMKEHDVSRAQQIIDQLQVSLSTRVDFKPYAYELVLSESDNILFDMDRRNDENIKKIKGFGQKFYIPLDDQFLRILHYTKIKVTHQEQYTPYGEFNYVMRYNEKKQNVNAKLKMIYRTRPIEKKLSQAARNDYNEWAKKYVMGKFKKPEEINCRMIIKGLIDANKYNGLLHLPKDYDMTCQQMKDNVMKSQDGSYGFSVNSDQKKTSSYKDGQYQDIYSPDDNMDSFRYYVLGIQSTRQLQLPRMDTDYKKNVIDYNARRKEYKETFVSNRKINLISKIFSHTAKYMYYVRDSFYEDVEEYYQIELVLPTLTEKQPIPGPEDSNNNRFFLSFTQNTLDEKSLTDFQSKAAEYEKKIKMSQKHPRY